MGKRVNDFSKEHNLKNADVIAALEELGFPGKKNLSGLDSDQEAKLLVKFGIGAAKETPAPTPAPAKAEEKPVEPVKENKKPEEKKPEGEAPKKKNISFVFNSSLSSGDKKKRPEGKKDNRDGQNKGQQGGGQSKRPNGNNAPQTENRGIIKPRPQGERAMRPASERFKQEETYEVKQEQKPETKEVAKEQRPAKKEGAPQGDFKKKPDAERNQDRNQNQNQGRRDDRKKEERKDKPSFQNQNQDRRNQKENSRGNENRQGDSSRDRNNAFRSQGNRSDSRFPGNRSQEQGRNKIKADVAPAPMEETKKDNRKKAPSNNNKKSYEKGNTRNQENFVNLEKSTGHKKRNATPQAPREDADVIKSITLPEKITIKELADRMKVSASEIIKKLFMKGQMVTVNNEVSYDEAEEIALEFNYIAEPEEKVDVIAELLKEDEEDEAVMVSRAPVVCVMGHVDHGKTSLLDAIRHTKVTDKEAGGITQAIGAYVVEEKGEKITFLDTPGHEAFTAMRMRGANSTDIAILVVAADDGVMPQTVEAINHAKAAGVEIIVAINKIDKPAANIDKVKQELSEYELIPEDWGGSTVFCPVSAHTKEGIDNLLDMILLTAEVLELKANPNRMARGLVIEAQLDKGRGAVATVLVQKGTLKVGQPIACGSCYGKIRAMIDDKGRRVKEAGPSTPVEILGLNNVPEAGETFVAFESDKEAKTFADTYIAEGKNKLIEDTKAKMSLDDLFSQIQSGNLKELDIIVKADVMGSVEAVKNSLVKLSNDEVIVKVIHGGVGAINESDVILASASNAIIIGFNVRPDPQAKQTAEREGVDLRLYKVIYNAIEDVEAAMKGMLDPIFEEKIIGHAEVRQVFKASGVGNIAGSYVLDGVFERGCKVRLSREGEQIFEGNLASLKRFKDDVKEVKTGFECGLVLEGFSDVKEFDLIEAYKMVEVPR